MGLHFFKAFTQEEIDNFKSVFGENCEMDGNDTLVLNQPDAYEEIIRFLKYNDSYYVEVEEEEGAFEERDNCIFLMDHYWWYKVDMEGILRDYANGTEIDPNEYRIY